MAQQITPVVTDNVDVIAPTTLAFQSVLRGTMDLRTKFGATLFMRLGRMGATAPSPVLRFLARRVLNNGSAGGNHPHTPIPYFGSNISGHATTVSADSNSGQKVLTIATIIGFATDDIVCIYDAAFTRLEFQRVSRVVGSTIILDNNLQYTHTAAQADNVTRIAEVDTFWLPGGSLWEVLVDNPASSGSTYVVDIKAQTYDLDTVVEV